VLRFTGQGHFGGVLPESRRFAKDGQASLSIKAKSGCNQRIKLADGIESGDGRQSGVDRSEAQRLFRRQTTTFHPRLGLGLDLLLLVGARGLSRNGKLKDGRRAVGPCSRQLPTRKNGVNGRQGIPFQGLMKGSTPALGTDKVTMPFRAQELGSHKQFTDTVTLLQLHSRSRFKSTRSKTTIQYCRDRIVPPP
jgi:hypothetical protein